MRIPNKDKRQSSLRLFCVVLLIFFSVLLLALEIIPESVGCFSIYVAVSTPEHSVNAQGS